MALVGILTCAPLWTNRSATEWLQKWAQKPASGLQTFGWAARRSVWLTSSRVNHLDGAPWRIALSWPPSARQTKPEAEVAMAQTLEAARSPNKTTSRGYSIKLGERIRNLIYTPSQPAGARARDSKQTGAQFQSWKVVAKINKRPSALQLQARRRRYLIRTDPIRSDLVVDSSAAAAAA